MDQGFPRPTRVKYTWARLQQILAYDIFVIWAVDDMKFGV